MTMQRAQNSDGTAGKRTVGRPFPKGTSGNPGGRPRGLAEQARRATRDGAAAVKFMASVLAGKIDGSTVKDRIMAATWLCDRGYGRPLFMPDPQTTLTREQAFSFVSALLSAIHRHVNDRATLEAVATEFQRLTDVVQIDYRCLTDLQLKRLINGEHPFTVIATPDGENEGMLADLQDER